MVTFTDLQCCLLIHWRQLQVRDVVYHLRCRLPICRCQLPIRGEKMVKTDPKKVQSQKKFLHVYIGTMAQLSMKTKNLTSQSLWMQFTHRILLLVEFTWKSWYCWMGCGGLNLRLPVGGWAKGIPWNSLYVAFLKPVMVPMSVETVTNSALVPSSAYIKTSINRHSME